MILIPSTIQMADIENYLKPLPPCPTPRADCGDLAECSDWFACPLSPATDERGLSELFPGARTSWPELDGFSDLFPCPSQLEGTFSNDAPLSPPPTDDCYHFECSDIDDALSHHQDGGDNRNDKNHGEDGYDEDDVVFISSQPIRPRDSSSPIQHEDFPDPTQESPSTSPKHVEDTTRSNTSSTQPRSLIQNQESLAQGTESFMKEPSFVLGLLVATILHKTAQDSSSESSLLGVATQHSSQDHQMIPDETLKTNKPLKVKTNASASPRKRKLEAGSVQEGRSRSKKTKLSSFQPEVASYKPINVILDYKDTAESQPETWKYEWNSQRQRWIAEEAPQEMRELRGEVLLSWVDDLTISVRPNLDWIPVDMRWCEGVGGEEGVFEGSDILEKDWTYQITPGAMLLMLCESATGLGTVTK
ncbi:hypothetical protein FOMA001_g19820 [Fusarium oxysporum f. sp. matthiolae]|nr:hypothetical protein FOMA001_g19820 [Fusarium oxysporum f. sp. matthiolae]